MLYTNVSSKTQEDLWILPLDAGNAGSFSPKAPIALLQSPFREAVGRISPDGHFIAYNSNDSGAVEVYVRPFSPDKAAEFTSGGKWMVSKGGGAGEMTAKSCFTQVHHNSSQWTSGQRRFLRQGLPEVCLPLKFFCPLLTSLRTENVFSMPSRKDPLSQVRIQSS